LILLQARTGVEGGHDGILVPQRGCQRAPKRQGADPNAKLPRFLLGRGMRLEGFDAAFDVAISPTRGKSLAGCNGYSR